MSCPDFYLLVQAPSGRLFVVEEKEVLVLGEALWSVRANEWNSAAISEE